MSVSSTGVPSPPSRASIFSALAVVGGVYNWYGALIAGLLLRAIPALLTDLGIEKGYVTIGIFRWRYSRRWQRRHRGSPDSPGLLNRLRAHLGKGDADDRN